MTDAFDTADFYSFEKDNEVLKHETVAAAMAWFADQAGPITFPITVYAYKAKEITETDIEGFAAIAREEMIDAINDEFGDPNGDGDIVDDETEMAIDAAIVSILLNAKLRSWQCDLVGERTFTEMP